MKAQAQPDPIGSVIAGRFRVEGPLGAGGMAHVVRATDIATGRGVAVKLLKPEIAQDEQAVARLRREGEVLSKLDHPAIVGIETFGKLDDGRIFIAMELLEGETLGERVRRQGQLAPKELTPIVTGAAAGLAAAHRNDVIHRDLKPDNVFLAGSPMQVKLLDFGISKVFGFAKLTRTGQILGTPRYMAPEQLAADDDVDQRIDVYAMGVILYEALAGTPPFAGVNASELIVQIIRGKAVPLRTYCPDMDPALETVVMRAMSRSREARFDTALELAEAWVTTVEPLPEKKPAAKALATSFFGGMEAAAFAETMVAPSEPPPAAAEPPPAAALRAGTFPEMEEHKDIRPPESGGWSSVEEPPPTAGALPRHVARHAVHEQRAHEAAHFEPAQLQETGGHDQVAAAAPDVSAAHLPVVPTRPTWLLVVVALIGGALSAALVLFLMGRGGEEPPETVVRPPEAPALLGGEEAPSPDEAAPDVEGTMDPESDVVGAHPPEPEEPETTEMRTTMRSGMRAGMTEERGPRTTGAILADARQALSVGNTSACLEFLDEIGSRRPAAALKLEGDCHQRAGDLGAALRTYTRYCAIFPRGPAIDEVRGRVQAAGGDCP